MIKLKKYLQELAKKYKEDYSNSDCDITEILSTEELKIIENYIKNEKISILELEDILILNFKQNPSTDSYRETLDREQTKVALATDCLEYFIEEFNN